MTFAGISRLSASATVTSSCSMRTASRLAGDDVIVGEDVAVAADDDAGAETVLDAATRSEEVIRVAEEGEERVARHLTPDDLLRRDVDDGGDGPLGDAAEVGERRRRPRQVPAR